jgi:hypothetical protein
MPDRLSAPSECANCGAEIPRGARACPECGADERTGWRETSVYDGLELPDESAPRRTRGRTSRDVNGLRWYWWCAGVAILLLFAFGVLALM